MAAMLGMFAPSVLAALALAACGGASSTGSTHNTQVISSASHAAVSQQSTTRAFLQLPNARRDDLGDVEYLVSGEDPGDLQVGAACTVNVILATPQEVATYRGDQSVVLNPAGTAGVKVNGTDQYQAGCLREASNVLKGVG